jgi:hypothetical protein
MPTTKVLYGHELADLCDESLLFETADLNNISITDALTPGVRLSVPAASRKKLDDEKIEAIEKPVTVKAIAGQTWVDLAMQQLGDEERIFELCDNNKAGITDEVEAQKVIKFPSLASEKKRIVNILSVIKPSSMFYGTGDLAPDGIEFWAIEFEFLVS